MPRAKKAVAVDSAPVIAYKGFNADWTCQGFQYAIGQTYRHDGEVKCCPQKADLNRGAGGFHACQHPLNVFNYYSPATSVFAEVELSGKTECERSGDTKIAAAEITIRAELKLPDLIARAVKYVFDRAKWIDGTFAQGEREGVRCNSNGGAATASGDQGAATASGTRGTATASGDQGAATASGTRGAATASGDQGAATASGWQGAATASGDQGAATASGDQGAATASGDQGAATASGTWGAATASGWQGAATASGMWGAATASGMWGAATASGENGIAIACGREGKARGTAGSDLVLREFDQSGKVIARWLGTVGEGGIKPDTFYCLVDGKPVETE